MQEGSTNWALPFEEDAWDRWIYLTHDADGHAIVLTREEWEALFRSPPEDQG